MVASAQANAANRSVAEQIEHWANIGKMMEENQDLPYEFVRDTLRNAANSCVICSSTRSCQ
nr:ParD-like family protein [Vibrio alginolyticus]